MKACLIYLQVTQRQANNTAFNLVSKSFVIINESNCNLSQNLFIYSV